MSGVMVVASREIAERKAWLLASVAFGLVQLALPLARVLDGTTRDALALALALAVPLAMAAALGSSILARDIGERRLGFYFSRPLSAFGIWGGKMLAAFVLTAAAIALVVGPVLWSNADLVPAVALVAPLVVVAGAHVVASALRSGAGLLPLDFVALVVLGGVKAFTVQTMLQAGAQATLMRTAPALVGAGVAVVLFAGFAQVAWGRQEPHRGHRALSAALWSGLGVLVFAFAGFARWVLAVTPAETGVSPWAIQVPVGGEVFYLGGATSFEPVSGLGRAGYAPSFWIDARSGAWAPGPGRLWHVFSPDGRLAVSVEADPPRLVRRRLDQTPSVEDVVVLSTDPGWPLALSPGGERLLTRDADALRVFEVGTGRPLGAFPITHAEQVRFRGLDVRLVTVAAGVGSLVDWDPQTARHSALASFPLAESDRLVDLHELTAVVADASGALRLVDLASGTARPLPDGTRRARFLSSGGLALVVQTATDARVETIGPDGSRQHSVSLGAVDAWSLEMKRAGADGISVGQSAAWTVDTWAPRGRGGHLPQQKGIVVVSLPLGRVVRSEPDLSFATREWKPLASDGDLAAGLAARLVVTPCGALVDWNALTGERRTLVECRAKS